MPGRNDAVIYQSNCCNNGSKRRVTDDHRTIRQKRSRNGSGSNIDSPEIDPSLNPHRRNRRNTTSHIESPKVIQSSCILEQYDQGSPSSSALRDQNNQRHLGVNRLDGLDEENSLASSVFVDHQLLNSCNSPKDSIIENAECLLEKADPRDVVCVVNVNDSEPSNTCEAAGLLIQDEENIDTSANVENDDVGSTDAEEEEECDCTSKSGYNDEPGGSLERQNTIELLSNDENSTLIVDTVDCLNHRSSVESLPQNVHSAPDLSKHPSILIPQAHYSNCSEPLNQSLSSVTSSTSTQSLCNFTGRNVVCNTGLSSFSSNSGSSFCKAVLNKSSTDSSLENQKCDPDVSSLDDSDKSSETSNSKSFKYNVINSRHSCDLGLLRSSANSALSSTKDSNVPKTSNVCNGHTSFNKSPATSKKCMARGGVLQEKKSRKSSDSICKVSFVESITPSLSDSDSTSTFNSLNMGSLDCNDRLKAPGSSLNSKWESSSSKTQSEPRVYPLRSRIRRESLKKQLQARHNSPKTFDQLPTEILLRIVHYLNVQDLFRSQRVCKRLRDVIDCYLLLVKRINFSSGLPFAFLPESLDDAALKRILSRTPKVTHILGFYPKTIHGAYSFDGTSRQNSEDSPVGSLTYAGIIDGFTCCTKLRSVELMDVELMSHLVQCLPLVKFHGMFRNRPDSWDSEYALPMPPEPTYDRPFRSESTNAGLETRSVVNPLANITPLYGCHVGTLFGTVSAATTSSDNNVSVSNSSNTVSNDIGSNIFTSSGNSSLAHIAASYAHNAALKASRLAVWFEPLTETPIGHGSPSLQHLETNVNHPQNQPGILQNVGALGPRLLNIVAAAAVQQNPGAGVPMAVVDPHNQQLMPELILAAGALQNNQVIPQPANVPPVNNVMAMENANNPVFALAFAAAINMQRRRAPFFLIRGGPPEHVQQNRTHRRYPGVQLPQDSFTRNLHRKFVSPLPSIWSGMNVLLPSSITNLTKLDLVSVSINSLPKLDNIKYLHLKWIVFKQHDPFYFFSAPKLQSFVMNNCVGPYRVVRFVRIFTALSRALQLSRLELVGCRFVDGLIEHIIDNGITSPRSFRNLQRLVMTGNKDATEMDLGFLLVAGQQSLGHIAIQTWHSRNSLFEALSIAKVKFTKLESLTLGYQDPYQSRLTATEITNLNLVDSWDSQIPMCMITDRGMKLCLKLCPRLTCLCIKHAPFLENLGEWVADCANEQVNHEVVADQPEEEDENKDEPRRNEPMQREAWQQPVQNLPENYLPLRSLTLENCPNITIDSLEDVIHKGVLFPCLDTIVLRDMFFVNSGTKDILTPSKSWENKWLHRTTTETLEDSVDYRNSMLLLALADSLFACRLGFPPLSPAGVGLGSSVRDISISPASNVRLNNSLKTFDLFLSMRLHTYLSSITQMDGTCGLLQEDRIINGHSILKNVLLGDIPLFYENNNDKIRTEKSDFISQGTQTCICGLLEVDALRQLQHEELSSDATFKESDESRTGYDESQNNNHSSQENVDNHTYFRGIQQLEGPLAFHPFVPSTLHMRLHNLHVASNWTEEIHPKLQAIYSPANKHNSINSSGSTRKTRSREHEKRSVSNIISYSCSPLMSVTQLSCIICTSNPKKLLENGYEECSGHKFFGRIQTFDTKYSSSITVWSRSISVKLKISSSGFEDNTESSHH